MPRKRAGRPTWFRMPLGLKPLFELYGQEDAGAAIMLALEYFDNKTLPTSSNTIGALTIFTMLKAEIDKSFSDYDDAVENGRKSRIVRDEPE